MVVFHLECITIRVICSDIIARYSFSSNTFPWNKNTSYRFPVEGKQVFYLTCVNCCEYQKQECRLENNSEQHLWIEKLQDKSSGCYLYLLLSSDTRDDGEKTDWGDKMKLHDSGSFSKNVGSVDYINVHWWNNLYPRSWL